MHPRTEKLHQLMYDNKLRADAVAAIVQRDTNTVRIWRCQNTKRVIPVDALRILEIEAPKVAEAFSQAGANFAAKQAAKAIA